MAEKRRGLGRGIGALIPSDQQEKPTRPIDVFFSQQTSTEAVKPERASSTKSKSATKPKQSEKPTRSTKVKERNSNDDELVPVPGATYGEIAVTAIIPNTKQPRTVFDEDDLQELADSITEVGVLQPIVVRPLAKPRKDQPDARYELIMGERRWRASQRAGMVTIPAVVRHTEDEDLLRDALLENLHRAQLNVLEEAAAYQQLLDDFQITHEELSKKIARSRPQISNTLRLLKLPPLVQRRVAAGVLSAGHARALLSLSDPAAMEQLAQRIVAEGLSVRSVEEIVALGGEQKQRNARARSSYEHQAELNEIAQELEDQLNTRVKARMGKRKGMLTIEFSDLQDLSRILAAMQ